MLMNLICSKINIQYQAYDLKIIFIDLFNIQYITSSKFRFNIERPVAISQSSILYSHQTSLNFLP